MLADPRQGCLTRSQVWPSSALSNCWRRVDFPGQWIDGFVVRDFPCHVPKIILLGDFNAVLGVGHCGRTRFPGASPLPAKDTCVHSNGASGASAGLEDVQFIRSERGTIWPPTAPVLDGLVRIPRARAFSTHRTAERFEIPYRLDSTAEYPRPASRYS